MRQHAVFTPPENSFNDPHLHARALRPSPAALSDGLRIASPLPLPTEFLKVGE